MAKFEREPDIASSSTNVMEAEHDDVSEVTTTEDEYTLSDSDMSLEILDNIEILNNDLEQEMNILIPEEVVETEQNIESTDDAFLVVEDMDESIESSSFEPLLRSVLKQELSIYSEVNESLQKYIRKLEDYMLSLDILMNKLESINQIDETSSLINISHTVSSTNQLSVDSSASIDVDKDTQDEPSSSRRHSLHDVINDVVPTEENIEYDTTQPFVPNLNATAIYTSSPPLTVTAPSNKKKTVEQSLQLSSLPLQIPLQSSTQPLIAEKSLLQSKLLTTPSFVVTETPTLKKESTDSIYDKNKVVCMTDSSKQHTDIEHDDAADTIKVDEQDSFNECTMDEKKKDALEHEIEDKITGEDEDKTEEVVEKENEVVQGDVADEVDTDVKSDIDIKSHVDESVDIPDIVYIDFNFTEEQVSETPLYIQLLIHNILSQANPLMILRLEDNDTIQISFPATPDIPDEITKQRQNLSYRLLLTKLDLISIDERERTRILKLLNKKNVTAIFTLMSKWQIKYTIKEIQVEKKEEKEEKEKEIKDTSVTSLENISEKDEFLTEQSSENVTAKRVLAEKVSTQRELTEVETQAKSFSKKNERSLEKSVIKESTKKKLIKNKIEEIKVYELKNTFYSDQNELAPDDVTADEDNTDMYYSGLFIEFNYTKEHIKDIALYQQKISHNQLYRQHMLLNIQLKDINSLVLHFLHKSHMIPVDNVTRLNTNYTLQINNNDFTKLSISKKKKNVSILNMKSVPFNISILNEKKLQCTVKKLPVSIFTRYVIFPINLNEKYVYIFYYSKKYLEFRPHKTMLSIEVQDEKKLTIERNVTTYTILYMNRYLSALIKHAEKPEQEKNMEKTTILIDGFTDTERMSTNSSSSNNENNSNFNEHIFSANSRKLFKMNIYADYFVEMKGKELCNKEKIVKQKLYCSQVLLKSEMGKSQKIRSFANISIDVEKKIKTTAENFKQSDTAENNIIILIFISILLIFKKLFKKI